MKIKNRFFKIAFFSTILIFCSALLNFKATDNLPDHTSEFYINDFAGVLNQETKQYILNNSKALDDNTLAQIVVATVNSLDGADLDNYALSLFRKWGIGNKAENNGLLVLLVLNERKVKVEVGYGLEGIINDAKAGRFLDEYAIPYFKNDNWNQGIKTFYSALISEVYSGYEIDMPENVSDVLATHTETYESSQVSTIIGFVVIALVVVFGGIFPLILRRKNRRGLFTDDDSDGGFWGFGGGFGGGFGDGGGFGGFSGGGGSAGGGGASRGF